MRVFLLEKEAISPYILSKDEAHYLKRVLRLSLGAVFASKDKNGVFYKATLMDKETLKLEITDEYESLLLDGLSSYKGPFADISIAIGITKNRKYEKTIRSLTEMGIRKIVLIKTALSEKEIKAHDMERLMSIVREAVQQSGAEHPEIIGPIEFEKALESDSDISLILHQNPLSFTMSLKEALERADIKTRVYAIIGAESGFEEDEALKAIERGFRPVMLNTNILRAETAAVYVASSIQTLIQG